MKYLLYLGFPMLVQAMFTFIASQTSSGGSFAGLGAMLFALLGIPLTLIINFRVDVVVSAGQPAGAFQPFVFVCPDAAGAAGRAVDRGVGVSLVVCCSRRTC